MRIVEYAEGYWVAIDDRAYPFLKLESAWRGMDLLKENFPFYDSIFASQFINDLEGFPSE